MKIVYLPSWYPKEDKDLTGIFIQEQIEAMQPYLDASGVLMVRAEKARLNSKLDIDEKNGIKSFNKKIAFIPKRSLRLFRMWCSDYVSVMETYIKLEGKPDLIHAHGYMGGLFAHFLSKKFNIPFGITIHDTSLIAYPIKSWKLNLLQIALKSSSFIIAVSTFLKEELEKLVHADAIIVIPNLVHDRFHKNSLKPKIEKGYTFGIVGSLDMRKRVSLAIDALHLINEKQYLLLIAGDGKEKRRIIRKIRNYKLEDQVELLGWISREEMPKFIERIDYLISSSSLETFGISLIEAMAMGKPVVATNSGGVQDIMNSKNGILVYNDSAESISKAMQKITNSSFNVEQIRDHTIEKYGRIVIVQKLLNLYKTVI